MDLNSFKSCKHSKTEMLNNKIVTIAKTELAKLPAVAYNEKIILVETENDLEEAVADLKREGIIGFDTETKPSFKRGKVYNVSLLQLSTRSTCYLFRLNIYGLPDSIKDILEDSSILKIGLSIHDDFHNLHKVYSINPDGFIELQNFVKKYNISDNSLSRIYGILFGHRISKGQRLSNWEATELSTHQKAYAAMDALACLHIYDYLISGKFDPEKSQYLTEINEEVDNSSND